MTVMAGLGKSEKAQQLATIGRVLDIQKTIMQGGGNGTLVTESNIYQALSDFVRHASGYTNNKYFTDPASPEAMQARKAKTQQVDPTQKFMEMQAHMQAQDAKSRSLRAMNEKQRIEIESLTKKRQVDLDYAKHTENLQLDYDKLNTEQTANATELELVHNEDVPGSLV